MDPSNTHTALNCCLCEELSSKAFPGQYRSAYPVDSRICYETDEFVVLPTLSPLCAGHVLILPRRHVTNLATLPETARNALLVCARSTVRCLTEHFGSDMYFFEHGVSGAGLACGIDHAHLHVLPLSAITADMVESRVEADFSTHDADGLCQVLTLAGRIGAMSYLLHGDSLDSIRISLAGAIPSQYMRRLIAEVECRGDWDWKLLSAPSEFASTCGAFKHA